MRKIERVLLGVAFIGLAAATAPLSAFAAEDNAAPPSPGLMQHDAREERPERKELREEMQRIRSDMDSLHAEQARVRSECAGEQRNTPDCKDKFAELKKKREALHQRMADLKKKTHEERLRHPRPAAVAGATHGPQPDQNQQPGTAPATDGAATGTATAVHSTSNDSGESAPLSSAAPGATLAKP